MMKSNEQIEEFKISFYTFFFEKEDNKELRKNGVNGKRYFWVHDTLLQRDN